MHLEWVPIAADEARDARIFYEAQRPGLGADFQAELKNTEERILAFPLAWAKSNKSVRRAWLKGFPYALHYLTSGERIWIVGVYHSRRAPFSMRYRR